MSVGGIVQRRVEAMKSMLAIPPISESMAGVIILYVFTNSVATSIWMFNAWSPFVYTLFGGSNFYVGLMAAVNGVFELTAAMASGHIADKVMGPSRMLQFAVRFGLFTLSVVLIAIWSKRASFLVFAQCCEGTYMGLSFTCLESVFAQCLRRGERDRLYSIKFSFEAAGPIAGLLLSIVLYSVVGDAWDIGILRCVMTAGLVLHLCSLTTFLCTFKPLPWVGHDGNTAEEDEAGAADGGVGEEATDVAVCPAAPAGVEHLCDREDSRLEVDVVELELPPSTMPGPTTEVANRARCAIVQSAGAAPIPASRYEPSVCTALEATEDGHLRNATFFTAPPSSQGEEEEEEERKKAKPTQQGPAAPNADKGCYVDLELEKARGCRRKMMICIPLRWYPVIVALADAILIFGSGMTTQYFTLFMMNVYDVGPVSMAFLNLANSCLISFLAISCGYMGRRYGRVRALLPPKLTGSFILLWMALARGTSYAPKFLMCIAYVLRNALMNCSAGLSRALIMDLVPEGQRGRWNAIESVQSAGWSGTALFGGFLADHLGYGAAFIFTFFFHITACTLLLPLTVRNDARLPQLIASPPKVVESAQSGSSTSVHGDGDDNAIVVELTEENIKTCIVRTETTS